MTKPKRIVYVLRSASSPDRYYTGVTSDLRARVDDHNAGRCAHTAAHGPWRLHVVVTFADEAHAIAFEHYLKSSSGNAFAMRHFR